MDDDGLVGDDVCAHPTANTVPTTTAKATNEEGTDIDNSFSNERVDESCRLTLERCGVAYNAKRGKNLRNGHGASGLLKKLQRASSIRFGSIELDPANAVLRKDG